MRDIHGTPLCIGDMIRTDAFGECLIVDLEAINDSDDHGAAVRVKTVGTGKELSIRLKLAGAVLVRNANRDICRARTRLAVMLDTGCLFGPHRWPKRKKTRVPA